MFYLMIAGYEYSWSFDESWKGFEDSKRKDYYKILGISKTSSMAEIKRAYKKLALQFHPDKNVDNREEAEAKFREVAAAYEVFMNANYYF